VSGGASQSGASSAAGRVERAPLDPRSPASGRATPQSSRRATEAEGAQAGRPPWFDAHLSPRDFQRIGAFIEANIGIRMPEAKRTMVEARLRSRLRDLGLSSFSEYCDRALAGGDAEGELVHLVDQVTTNKTDFFREPGHFDYLAQQAWPTLVRERGAGVERELTVWSAACSSGEEPYTLAMVLSEVALAHPGWRFQILATDICTQVLAQAQRAIYAVDRIAPIPPRMRERYLLQSRDPEQKLVRIAPALRGRVRFRQLNLMDQSYGIREPVDVIFCRNVFIYFDRCTQERILNHFCRHLAPGGYVFLGHSEAINGHDVPLRAVAPTTYRAP
jgi:chemotaxis protein methyltransferase CheR